MNVLLFDVIPSRNKGEGAILNGVHALLREISPDIKLSILSMAVNASKDREEYAGIVDQIYILPKKDSIWARLFKSRLYLRLLLTGLMTRLFKISIKPGTDLGNALHAADLVLYGHDNVIASAGFSWGSYILGLYCRWLNKPLVFCMGSIGPFRGWSKIVLAKLSLKTFQSIAVRDKRSYLFIKTLTNMDRVRLTLDPAFYMPPCSQSETLATHNAIGMPKPPSNIVGLSLTYYVMRFAHPEIKNLDRKIDLFLGEFAHAITDFMENNPEISCILVPHGFGPTITQDDRVYMKQFIRLLQPEIQKRIYTFETEYSSKQLKGLIGAVDLFVAMRTHAMIAALSMGIPTVALSTDSRYKTNGIIGDFFGLYEYICMIEQFDKNTFPELLQKAWQNREHMKQTINGKRTEIEKEFMAVKGLLSPYKRKHNIYD